MSNNSEQADALARACADFMWAQDRASQNMGMQIETITAGQAILSMPVRMDMVNGHNICHGGHIFTLADSAFAFACNGYNQRTVAQHCSISFLVPAQLNDQLRAHAHEIFRQGRSGLYDVHVTRADGTRIAEFRGHSRTIKGANLPSSES